MKTASDWALELFVPLRKTEPVAWERCDKINAKVVTAIRVEALREAAEICNARITENDLTIEAQRCRDAILAKANSLEKQ